MDITEDDKFDKLISKALETEKQFELPHSFADRIVNMVEVKSVVKESRSDRWWLVLGIISMIGAFAFAFTKVKLDIGVGAYTFFRNYWGLAVFGLIFITALHFVDKLILRKQESG
jgi:hypothetical protein